MELITFHYSIDIQIHILILFFLLDVMPLKPGIMGDIVYLKISCSLFFLFCSFFFFFFTILKAK